MIRSHLAWITAIALLIAACHTPKTLTDIPPAQPFPQPIEDEMADESPNYDSLYQLSAALQDSFVTAYFEEQLATYRPSATREHDLLHTKLDLRFDWENQYVLGKAWVTLTPYFYNTDSLVLDAKGFDIKTVSLHKGNSATPLPYTYDDKQITIQLGKTYTRKDTFTVYIDYVAKPADRKDVGGSAAISSNQGLFFINPQGKVKDKPTQIWTQGETEHNSRWFPTFDKPNERCTQEMYLTVEDKFKTLSNGVLVSETKNADGTRTDYWKMDMPHAPYLFMIAVGEFAVVKDTWKGKDIYYYVEPKYEKDARAIFANTPEMMQFFSDKLGLQYPWQKYASVVVRDYVSGAMENTTATIFGEYVQKHKDELTGVGNDLVVAHELFHHWFGDYVTCESWSNLTLNEGFANYSEYLWFEHKYGKDEAGYHLINEQQGYFGNARGGVRPIIHYNYDDKEDMFDAHSYNKGGCVLHMLRNQIGDEAFFKALNIYLNRHAFTAVEADHLRQAFEEVTGQDLKWFFDQWFMRPGHPKLDISYQYNAAKQEMQVTIEQKQEPMIESPVFILPMAIDIYTKDGAAPRRENIKVEKRKQTFTFKVPTAPLAVNVDADKVLLAEKIDRKSDEEWVFMYYNAKNYIDRYEALQALGRSGNPKAIEVFKAALKDPHHNLRTMAQELLDQRTDATPSLPDIERIALHDENLNARIKAVEILAATGEARYFDTFKHILVQQPASPLLTELLTAMHRLQPEATLLLAAQYECVATPKILSTLATLYAAHEPTAALHFFENNWACTDGYAAIEFFSAYQQLVRQLPGEQIVATMSFFKDIATDPHQLVWIRFGAAKAIKDMATDWNETNGSVAPLQQMLTTIKDRATNTPLAALYSTLL